MRVLVTGGAGFIGSHIVDALIKRGDAVAVIDDMSSGFDQNIPNGTHFYTGSICEARIDDVFSQFQPDTVIHLAGLISPPESMLKPKLYAEVNVKGTINVLENAAAFSVRRFIFASTAAVYRAKRESEWEWMLPEGYPLLPSSVYGATKLSAEYLVKLYAGMYDFRYKVLRYSNVYGPRQRTNMGVISIMASRMHRGGRIVIKGDGSAVRDYIHVDDAVAATIAACGYAGDNNTYNISTGVGFSVNQIFDFIRDAYSSRRTPEYEWASEKANPSHFVLHPHKAKRESDWEARIPVQTGISRLCELIREQKVS